MPNISEFPYMCYVPPRNVLEGQLGARSFVFGIDAHLKAEVVEWLNENMPDGYWHTVAGAVLFRNEQDALLFKMRWS